MSATLEETFNPAALNASSGLVSGTTGNKASQLSAPKQTKTAQTYPRIDFEPLYTDLKSHIGHNWSIYHDALTRFVRGELSSGEFGYLTDEFVYVSSASEHAHNSLICAIIHNVGRDSPDLGPAPWVSATSDKTTGASSGKPTITSDAGEQRLKTEVMALLPRDRKRLKGIMNEKTDEENNIAVSAAVRKNGYEEYYNAGRIKAPEAALSNPGSLTKTNWELEIKKRYAQPLFSETIEFPDASTIFARMVPICYEESVGAGSNMNAAEYVLAAAEVYLKEFLGTVFIRTRSNGPRYENGAGGGILTARFKKQLLKEEEDVKSGRLIKNRDDDLLPVESAEVKIRRPLGINDLKLASHVGPSPWNGMPLLGAQVNEAQLDSEYDEWKADREVDTKTHLISNGNGSFTNGADDTDMDDDDYGWDGTGFGEREALGSLLEDCLAIRA